MIPPKYSLLPAKLLLMADLPDHLFRTYAILYALAWRHNYEWLDETLEQLTHTLTACAGEINPRGARQRLTDLSKHGLIERRQVGGRYRTYLKVRHEGGDVASVTCGLAGDVLGRHPISNSVVVEPGIDRSSEDQQQQQLLNKPGDVERNEKLLEAMGVVGGPRYRLARETWVTPEYLEGIMAYRVAEAAKGNLLGPGWVVKHIGEAWPVPEQIPGPEDDRYRYIRGKYRDYIKH